MRDQPFFFKSNLNRNYECRFSLTILIISFEKINKLFQPGNIKFLYLIICKLGTECNIQKENTKIHGKIKVKCIIKLRKIKLIVP